MTTAERQIRAKELFTAALNIAPSQRRAFVAEQCAADEHLREQIESLIRAHEEAGSFLASPTFGGDTEPDSPGLAEQLRDALAGRYTVEREIGRGGMGVVYLARDIALDRPVAIKLLRPSLAGSGDYRERFLREARTAAGLSHPHIVPIHLVEQRDGLVYFIMSFVDGESLGARVRRSGPLNPPNAAKLVQEIAWALAYAHSRGVIHRDIKPDNILLDAATGRALLTDFGIARLATVGTESRQGEVLGTFRYMSPEQASPDSTLDGRADLYSLGVTAFFALTARTPFEGDDPVALLAQHVMQPAPHLLSVRRDVPARLANAIDRCLAKDPDTRFATGEALADAIADAQVVRREVPRAVQEFLGTLRASLAQLTGIGVVWGTVAMVMQRVAPSRPMSGAPLDPLHTVLAVITGIVALRPILAARQLVRDGYDATDVAAAVDDSRSARDPDGEGPRQLARRRAARLAAPASRILLGLLALAIALSAIGMLVAKASGALGPLPLPTIMALRAAPLAIAVLAFAVLAPERFAGLVSRGAPANRTLLRRVFASAPIRGFIRLSGTGILPAARTARDAGGATEVLLGQAAASLYARLPEDVQERLGELPSVIGGLENVASELRSRRRDLEVALADIGGVASDRRAALFQELTAARQEVDQRLARAVSALDDLRLDLLRLGAGVGRVSDLTPSIEAARIASESIGVELAARREVESITETRDRMAG